MNHNFHVGGSHGKVYPWVFPDTALREINSETARKVRDLFTGMINRYSEIVLKKRDGGTPSPIPSDSSTDSGSVPIDPSSIDYLRKQGLKVS